MRIIGLGHYSRVGKDTLADIMMIECEARGLKVEKASFARKIKEIAHDLYAWAGMREPDFYDTPAGAPYRDIVLPALGKTPVQIWVDLGNNIREVYPETWLRYALRDRPNPPDVLFVPDVRFKNEVKALCFRGAYLVYVTREGVEPRDTKSDKELVGLPWWHEHVRNDGDLPSLQRRGAEIIDRLFK